MLNWLRTKQRWAPLLLFSGSLALYAATLAPTVATIFDDSLELQLALPTLAIIHPTGYPLYSLLGYAFTHLLPVGDAAMRANLLSAVAASATVSLLFVLARRLGSAVAPALVAAALLAVSPVWWSHATIAEVYTLQGLLTLLILLAALHWDSGIDAASRDRRLWLVALSVGVALTHHRMTLLVLPGLAVFMLWRDPGLLRRPHAWPQALLALAAPLLLYGLLPLRQTVGSLDGSYARIGFRNWVLGGGYSTFLRDNPFGIERTWQDIWDVWSAQYGGWGFVLGAVSLSHLRWQPRRLTLLALIAIADILFVRTYLVADYQVFLIPLIVLWPLFIALGLTALGDALSTQLFARLHRLSPARRLPLRRLLGTAAALLLLLWPLILGQQRFAAADRSHPPLRAWGVHDYGLDMLQNVAPDGRVVGILGEMTLLRYFQRTANIRPDGQTVAADADADRLAAIIASVNSGRATYTTRPLAGLPQRMQLDAAGPLVQVHAVDDPYPPASAGEDVALLPQVSLAGWQIQLRKPQSGPAARLTLIWQVHGPVPADFKISARLLAANGEQLAQKDDFPVHNSYPPTAWRPGEQVVDSYDLLLPTTTPAQVNIQVILYNPQDGSEIARWQQNNIPLP